MAATGGLIDLMARQHRSARRPRLAFTEWNCRNRGQREMGSAWRPGGSQYRLVDALAVAGFLNAMQRQCNVVGLATFAQTINVVGALVVTPEDLFPRNGLLAAACSSDTTAGPLAVDAFVDCDGYTVDVDGRTVPGIPWLDVSATLDDTTRRLFLSIVNRHRDDEIVTRVRVREATLPSTATVRQLWHADPLARNTADAPDTVAPVPAVAADYIRHVRARPSPPHSYSVVELSLGG